eukprot:TRINITY_DN26582_c0_g1_i1.p2 TRINITY_DN26582_c0_g1~~TRINITY_DN26582_c0_g1_i1.p2  ORF type:complete len:112 (+),score=14.42 TRINITY_DN26582_c0_g1_i1:29-364(+)
MSLREVYAKAKGGDTGTAPLPKPHEAYEFLFGTEKKTMLEIGAMSKEDFATLIDMNLKELQDKFDPSNAQKQMEQTKTLALMYHAPCAKFATSVAEGRPVDAAFQAYCVVQ